MTLDFIITSINKTKSQIFNLIVRSGLKGNILFGNQCADSNSIENIISDNFVLTIFNQTSKGVSINRNFLLKQSKADYVMFLDDDVNLIKNFTFDENKIGNVAYRYNCLSSNKNRPIIQINKNKKLSFNDVKSFGVWGICFPRTYLLDNNILFDENIGPGKYINHGEDSLFLKTFIKSGGKLLQINDAPFAVSQEFSTWKDGDFKRELISHGYVYRKIFGLKGWLIIHYYCLKHRKEIQMSCKISVMAALKLLKAGFHLKEDKIRELNK